MRGSQSQRQLATDSDHFRHGQLALAAQSRACYLEYLTRRHLWARHQRIATSQRETVSVQ